MSEQPLPAVNLTALLGEAMTKSGLFWIEVPGERARPAWHVWVDGTAYVVNGPGEQTLPWLPPEVRIILRSKDSGARLITVRAQTEVLPADTPATTASWRPWHWRGRGSRRRRG